jgi:hypothetical protein
MIGLGIAPYRKIKGNFRYRVEKLCAPSLGAFGARRLIGALVSISRKTKAHWNDADFAFVVKLLACHAHPIAQAFARQIIERDTRFMNPQAGVWPTMQSFTDAFSRTTGRGSWSSTSAQMQQAFISPRSFARSRDCLRLGCLGLVFLDRGGIAFLWPIGFLRTTEIGVQKTPSSKKRRILE